MIYAASPFGLGAQSFHHLNLSNNCYKLNQVNGDLGAVGARHSHRNK